MSGKPIKVISDKEIGNFAIPYLKTTPLGCVYLENKSLPSLFLTREWDPALYRYDCEEIKNDIPVFGPPMCVQMPSDLKANLPGSLVKYNDEIFAFWLKQDTIVKATYDNSENAFQTVVKFKINAMPRMPKSLTISISNGSLYGYLEVGDGVMINGPVHWSLQLIERKCEGNILFIKNANYLASFKIINVK